MAITDARPITPYMFNQPWDEAADFSPGTDVPAMYRQG
jgi:hypothetical protein